MKVLAANRLMQSLRTRASHDWSHAHRTQLRGGAVVLQAATADCDHDLYAVAIGKLLLIELAARHDLPVALQRHALARQAAGWR